jgi:hypothetical protein
MIAVGIPLFLITGVAEAAGWTVVPSPNLGVTANELNAVSVVAARDVWAVGDSIGGNGVTQTLTERWNGTTWSVVPSPNPSATRNVLTGVTAIASNDVWAVGRSNNTRDIIRTLIEHWDGTTWSVVPSPNASISDSFLSAVSAVSRRDVWAVGQGRNSNGLYQTLIEHWNGRRWSVIPSPNVGTHENALNGVTAISENDVWAVGDVLDATSTSHTLIEHWNGTTWSIIPSPDGAPGSGVLNAVQAVSATNIWAVGQTGTQTLVEKWNGASWNVVPSPNASTPNNLLRGIAIVSANNVWAVGFDVVNGLTLIEHWNGTTWSVVPSPNPSASFNNILNGVAADPRTGQTWAVGEFFNDASGDEQTLTEFHS